MIARLYVSDVGTGPAVVLLHGLPSPPEDLERLASELPGMRVLVPHLPGYGKSAPAPGEQGVAAVERALVERLRELRVERPALIGYSMGAYRALSLAPHVNARSVLALAGFAVLSAEERAGMAGFATMLREGQNVRAALPPRFRSEKHRAERPEDDAVVERWLDVAPASVLIEELEDLAAAPSLTEVIGRLECAVIARTGELDVATPPSHARAIAAAAKPGTLEIVPGVAHAMFLEDAAGTLDAIRRACACRA